MNKELIPTEIEKERFSLISEKDYNHYLDLFNIILNSNDFLLLKNHYFDTMIGLKIQNTLPGSTLRIRESIEGDFLELKSRQEDGSNHEFKDELDRNTKSILFSEGIIPVGNVREKLRELKILELYTLLGSLSVYRVQVVTKWEDVKVFLDKCFYPSGYIDYRIEVESGHMDYSEKVLIDILSSRGLEMVPVKSKFETFLENI